MKLEIIEGVYWVGAVDWNLRIYHNTYSTHHGTSYNSYLILDEKIALVDGVYEPFGEEMLERIKELIPPEKISYVIANHSEPDHSGALPRLMKIVPQAKVFCTAKGKDILSRMYSPNWDFITVKTGDEISLGRKTLRFIEAPMMHWPDNMFTYVKEDSLLLSNDAFGQHIASSQRFEDEVDQSIVWEESTKYFANTLYPFCSLIIRKIEEIQKSGIPIKMIAPSHGVIWRRDTNRVFERYLQWARGEAAERTLVIYETMWESTARMARAIAQGVQSQGMEVKVYQLSVSDLSDVFKEVMEARGMIVGCSTVHNTILPAMAPFIEGLKGLRPRGKLAYVFGSHGWGGGAVKVIESALKQAGIELMEPGLMVKYMPDEEELSRCFELGKRFAQSLRKVEIKEGIQT
jgi:flavorubredoxin